MKAAKTKAAKSANILDQPYEYGRIVNSDIDLSNHNLASLRES